MTHEFMGVLGGQGVFAPAGPAARHTALMSIGGDRCGLAHDGDLGAPLEQPHLVEMVFQRNDFPRRLDTGTGLFPQAPHPAHDSLIECRVPSQRVVDARASLHEAGQDVIDVVDRKGIVGAVLLDRAFRPRTQPVPLLPLWVALAAEQQVFALRPPRHQHRHGLRLRERRQIEKVAVLAKGIMGVAIARPLPCRGQDGHAALTDDLHQSPPTPHRFFRHWRRPPASPCHVPSP